jgi:hypothetical protein
VFWPRSTTPKRYNPSYSIAVTRTFTPQSRITLKWTLRSRCHDDPYMLSPCLPGQIVIPMRVPEPSIEAESIRKGEVKDVRVYAT